MAKQLKIGNTGAERYILSCCLNYPDSLLDIATKLFDTDFSEEYNAIIYRACLILLESKTKGKPDPATVYNFFEKLDKADLLAPLEGMAYIERIKDTPVDTDNIEEYIKEIKQASVRRQLIEALDRSKKDLIKDEETAPELLVEKVETELMEVHEVATNTSSSVYHMGEDASEILQARATTPGIMPGYSIGFPRLDADLQGLQSGRTFVLAASSKVGKSCWMLNVAKNLSITPTIDEQVPTLIISTEMQSRQDEDRLLSMLSDVEEKRIKNGLCFADKAETDKVFKAAQKIKDGQLYHVYTPTFTFETIYSVTRKYVKTKGVKVLILDYIKLPDDADIRRTAEWQWLGRLMSNIVNKIGGDMNIPVLTAAQINREGQKARGRHSYYIAGSDKIAHFTSGAILYLFEKNEEEKLATGYGPNEGTHIITVGQSRYMDSDLDYHFYFNKPKLQMWEKKAIPR